ncbi:hypothetical protein ThidrDRAFT_4660, partial [Thiorhodococcus drewsii AZ1]
CPPSASSVSYRYTQEALTVTIVTDLTDPATGSNGVHRPGSPWNMALQTCETGGGRRAERVRGVRGSRRHKDLALGRGGKGAREDSTPARRGTGVERVSDRGGHRMQARQAGAADAMGATSRGAASPVGILAHLLAGRVWASPGSRRRSPDAMEPCPPPESRSIQGAWIL